MGPGASATRVSGTASRYASAKPIWQVMQNNRPVLTAIILGAGRGSRLMPLTNDAPKCYAVVAGRRIIEWTLAALRAAGIERIVFVGGYRIDQISSDYPELEYRVNPDWRTTGTLMSLLNAREFMHGPVLLTMSDLLYTGAAIARLAGTHHDIVLAVKKPPQPGGTVCEPRWAPDTAVVAAAGECVLAADRGLVGDNIVGQYAGIAAFSSRGTAWLCNAYQRAGSGALQLGVPIRTARSMHLINAMVAEGTAVHWSYVAGPHAEVDSLEDLELARMLWK